LFEAFGALGLLFGAVAFAVSESPKVMAFDEERVEEFAMPGVRVKFCVGEHSVHVVLLKQGPGRDDSASEQVAPANGRLSFDEFAEGSRVLKELACWREGGVEVRAEAC
jgi:hypothetical protein